jgi:hypothetical protein
LSLKNVSERDICTSHLLGVACLSCRTICRPGMNLFFLNQFIEGNFPWSHRYKWETEG